MKKHFKILFLILIGSIETSNAQLIVNSDGCVAIKRDSCSMGAMLSLGRSSFNDYQDYMFGIISQTDGTFIRSVNIGVCGKAQVVNRNVNIGVQGLAYGTSTRNFGILGGLSGDVSACGAGVFGTTVNHTGVDIAGRYAGYFDGAAYVKGTLTATSLVTPSDMRLKENVVSLSDEEKDGFTTDKLLSLDVIHYNYIQHQVENNDETATLTARTQDDDTPTKHYGVSAQQLLQLYPDLVYKGQDGYLAVNYVELVPILLRSIQELKAEIDDMKAQKGAVMSREVVPSADSPTPNISFFDTSDKMPNKGLARNE